LCPLFVFRCNLLSLACKNLNSYSDLNIENVCSVVPSPSVLINLAKKGHWTSLNHRILRKKKSRKRALNIGGRMEFCVLDVGTLGSNQGYSFNFNCLWWRKYKNKDCSKLHFVQEKACVL
jgi:hypothetical protein